MGDAMAGDSFGRTRALGMTMSPPDSDDFANRAFDYKPVGHQQVSNDMSLARMQHDDDTTAR